MLEIIKDLFNYPRSVTGQATRETLQYIAKKVEKLEILKFKCGSKVYDWKIPDEWNINDAYIKEKSGKKILDFKKNLLCVVYHSISIKKWIDRSSLLKKIHVDNDLTNATPYVTSYYKKDWGFCMPKKDLPKLNKDKYFVHIDSNFKKGFLEIGEYFKKGKKSNEIFFSTYICHPSMANDNLSSIALQIYLINYLKKNYKKTNYSYRFVFLPETIGSISYLSKRLKILKKNMLMGFAISCVGDDKQYSIIKSRNENAPSLDALRSAVNNKKNVIEYSFLDRGSDERQYCYPGIDLPVSGFCRSRFHTFKEYHTDKDNLNYISAKGLQNSFEVFKNIIDALENRSFYPKNRFLCEPNLGKRGLMSTVGKRFFFKNKTLKNFLVYSDGKRNLFEISNLININIKECLEICKVLQINKLI
jgi:aminopeptidase-like protein